MFAAVQGAKFVVHTATQVCLEDPADVSTVIDPAVNGCLSVMKAAQTFKVKRVVITSSNAAICGMAEEVMPDEFDEGHWSDLDWVYLSP